MSLSRCQWEGRDVCCGHSNKWKEQKYENTGCHATMDKPLLHGRGLSDPGALPASPQLEAAFTTQVWLENEAALQRADRDQSAGKPAIRVDHISRHHQRSNAANAALVV